MPVQNNNNDRPSIIIVEVLGYGGGGGGDEPANQDDLEGRDGEIAGNPDSGFAGIDGAMRPKQIDIARRHTGHANQGCDAGAGLRRGRRLGHVGVVVVENIRRAGDDRSLLALAGVDVAIGRPDGDVAAEFGEDAGLRDDDTLIGEDVDVAALEGEQARPCRVRQPGKVGRLVLETECDATAGRQDVECAALVGADAGVLVERQAAIIRRGRPADHASGEQGFDRLVAAVIAAPGRGVGLAAGIDLGEIDLLDAVAAPAAAHGNQPMPARD
jgi:hypothetical protein